MKYAKQVIKVFGVFSGKQIILKVLKAVNFLCWKNHMSQTWSNQNPDSKKISRWQPERSTSK